MPYGEQAGATDHQHPAREKYVFEGDGGQTVGLSHLRLRDKWSAWTYDKASDRYHHTIHDTFDDALAALRERAPWADLPDAR